jgi:two-component system nitrogen regulation sensor histidine kinase NtrY
LNLEFTYCVKIALVEKPSKPKKRRSPPYILGALVFVLLLLLFLLNSSNIWRNLSVETASGTLLLYALSSLNFLAFIIFGFIFIRSLLKLSRERRALELGSKIKTRLLIFFIAGSLLPIIAMAFFSYLFMNRALDRWFTQIPENAIREAIEVHNRSTTNQSIKLSETARMLAIVLENQNPANEDLQKILESGGLTRLEIVSNENKTLAVAEKKLDGEQRRELEKTLSQINQKSEAESVLRDGSDLEAATANLSGGRRLIVVSNYPAQENISQLLESSLAEFDKLKGGQVAVRQIGILTLGVLTFLLIFASSWTAFYIARGLTVPIKALAEGADEIAQGNLSHRVETLAEDELALLVSAFNQMSAKLEENSAELEERRRYIETVLQSLSTGVISLDSENRVTTINKAAVQILKLEDADLAKIELAKLVTEENRVVLERLLNRAKRIGQASEQTVLQRETGDAGAETNGNLPVALTATALPRNFGETGGVVLVIEDLSELLEAQRASAWQEVARRMAHEIKNPLTPIQLSAERIAKKFSGQLSVASGQLEENGEKQRTTDNGQLTKIVKDGTETILREVNSLKVMVDEFSRFARLPNVRLESGNLNEIVRQTVDLYEDRFANLRIEAGAGENLPNVMLDSEQLKRVFVNLIDNAIEAFDKTQEDRRIFIKTFHDAARDLVVAEVSDNGNGIPPSDFQKLFQPYFSTKNRGTGLGLAIVQRIVSEHHGRIKAVSNQPRGARFIIELPVLT